MAETASELRERVSLAHKSPSTSYSDLELLSSFKDKVQQAKEDLHLHDGLTFGQYMLAGSMAGIVEHVAMFPVDTLKTRVQMLSGPCGSVHSLSKAFYSVMKTEGPSGLYRGLGAMILGAGPSHAAYFAVYEVCKEKFGGNKPGHHPFAHMAAGACATVASDAVLTPMDVVKQRLQLSKSPYRGVWDCVRRMLRDDGLRGFYVSYKTTVLMNVPFVGVHFATYEAAKKVLSEFFPDQASEERLITHMLAGGTAGALASAVTTPLDVVKTRLQCQGVCGAERFHSNSIREVVGRIIAHEGPGALFRGLKPRVLFHTPAAAISWSTYEGAKAFLQRWNERHAYDSG
ncbi:hypothetical protein O6H91_23G021900 [Diphasiastrum complanatum]|nr:hypothetical protein O6H91_23G021900 [Diphasiastrum complanatum]KAJ7513989.1 hypothetical protein O6H91_23G021900 [Diphasiastrum complanatum]KAJ7513990.1 hypothetical protein O6H91_23G021900 [Diphasiastrum complanatum]KAJ7513992.1 hypothetical protein O6H91_23G021900 [Diphasiastrum complanatum]KAJ7513993.1 hypothetical protein O6H91_23G021900 [Diphasiastrum complanatum]